MCAFENGNDSNNKLKGVGEPQSEFFEFEEYRNCLDGNDNEKNVTKMLVIQ